MAINLDNIKQVFSAGVKEALGGAGMVEAMTRIFDQIPGFAGGSRTIAKMLSKAQELRRQPPKTPPNILDSQEFDFSKRNLQEAFSVSWNPLTWLWTAFKYVFGLGSKKEDKIAAINRFATDAKIPYGPERFAVEAVETLLQIMHARFARKQGAVSRLINEDKLKDDPIVAALIDALGAWLPRIKSLTPLRHFSNELMNGFPHFVRERIGRAYDKRFRECKDFIERRSKVPVSQRAQTTTGVNRVKREKNSMK